MTQSSTIKFGTHALADFFDAQYLTDVATLRAALLAAAKSAGANILTDHFHEFPGRSGVTGVVLLEESHISIHTWPNDGFAAIDIFMCGEMSVDIAIDYLVTILKPQKHIVKRVERGGVI
jgi:S-adenosylmethionine decarboxylase